ncbi:hypothetical protein MTR67_025590 [Solanum verrucosum]|uniref:Uncharacterized protein n=1 Tax=Solanum verrucosum TaxID=315347 RepID=A0AAF0R3T2_SOLVR|nr:hypothetical protein MTR67_025590 [Solanum verrucosum]
MNYTFCGIELTIIIYSSYHNKLGVFSNHEAAINTFTKFRDLPTLVFNQKNMMIKEEFTKQKIETMEKQLHKIRKKITR